MADTFFDHGGGGSLRDRHELLGQEGLELLCGGESFVLLVGEAHAEQGHVRVDREGVANALGDGHVRQEGLTVAGLASRAELSPWTRFQRLVVAGGVSEELSGPEGLEAHGADPVRRASGRTSRM